MSKLQTNYDRYQYKDLYVISSPKEKLPNLQFFVKRVTKPLLLMSLIEYLNSVTRATT